MADAFEGAPRDAAPRVRTKYLRCDSSNGIQCGERVRGCFSSVDGGESGRIRGAVGNLVVKALGLEYAPGVPTNYNASGYESCPIEQIPDVTNGVTVTILPLSANGSANAGIRAILDERLFTRLPAVQEGKASGLQTKVKDFVTANQCLNEEETRYSRSCHAGHAEDASSVRPLQGPSSPLSL